MRRWLIVLTALLVAVGLTMGLAACGDDDDEGGAADTAAATSAAADLGLLEAGKLQVASDIPYAPFEFTEPGSTEAIGFDVDMVKAIAATPGIGITDVEFIKQPFDTIILSVAQGRFDMSASSFSITPERAKQIDFGDPYFVATQSVMVQKDSDITSLDDLQGKKIGAQRGTTGADLAATVQGAEVSRYEIIDDAFNALAAGRVDAVINDFAVSAYAAAQARRLQDRVAEPDHRELRPRVPEGEPGAARRVQRRPRRDQGERDLRRDLPQVVRRGPAGARRGPARRVIVG